MYRVIQNRPNMLFFILFFGIKYVNILNELLKLINKFNNFVHTCTVLNKGLNGSTIYYTHMYTKKKKI